jgi:long-chain acyl-CoA synthetase
MTSPAGRGGEAGVAFAVLVADGVATAQDLLTSSRQQLPSHAVPVAVHFVDELPRNSVGKLLRAALRERVPTSGR